MRDWVDTKVSQLGYSPSEIALAINLHCAKSYVDKVICLRKHGGRDEEVLRYLDDTGTPRRMSELTLARAHITILLTKLSMTIPTSQINDSFLEKIIQFWLEHKPNTQVYRACQLCYSMDS